MRYCLIFLKILFKGNIYKKKMKMKKGVVFLT